MYLPLHLCKIKPLLDSILQSVEKKISKKESIQQSFLSCLFFETFLPFLTNNCPNTNLYQANGSLVCTPLKPLMLVKWGGTPIPQQIWFVFTMIVCQPTHLNILIISMLEIMRFLSKCFWFPHSLAFSPSKVFGKWQP